MTFARTPDQIAAHILRSATINNDAADSLIALINSRRADRTEPPGPEEPFAPGQCCADGWCFPEMGVHGHPSFVPPEKRLPVVSPARPVLIPSWDEATTLTANLDTLEAHLAGETESPWTAETPEEEDGYDGEHPPEGFMDGLHDVIRRGPWTVRFWGNVVQISHESDSR
jgi:hypothetical protein